jgi:two-component system, NarL family, response regulator NreC
MSANSPIRLVIADDFPIFRKGLVHSINSRADASIQIVGEVDDGEKLIREVEHKKPDIVLTDIRMPNVCGKQASLVINTKFSFTSVIALTMYTEPDTIYQMFETGAKGYLTKTADINEIIEAIKTVHSGEMYYCSSSSVSLIKKIGPGKYNQYKKNCLIQFSEKEIQVMKLICMQLTTKEIADRMKISTRTVDEHSQNIKVKTEAKNLVGIALYAVKNNIVSVSDL